MDEPPVPEKKTPLKPKLDWKFYVLISIALAALYLLFQDVEANRYCEAAYVALTRNDTCAACSVMGLDVRLPEISNLPEGQENPFLIPLEDIG